ncbi:outer membrane beta-barrel protein [Flavobacterium ardleyense]|uniref:Outer membrane beta-barrel protein n=1 Tax=Flavobacterium ardleyense TaxID=2038737 RepID=A0ABW5ZD42_9FLAO
MKKNIVLIITTMLSLSGYSQINFEKGYYINNANQKIECLIKNIDWKNNPSYFEYKTSENANSETATIKSVKEFSIYNITKYVRSTVDIDRSSDFINALTNEGSPQFKEEELFLKLLIEGNANLYSYEDGNLTRYFYNKDNAKIEQLIYKKYLNSVNNIAINSSYKQQLWKDLNCETFDLSTFKNLDYSKKDLMNYFVTYNKCNNLQYTIFEKKKKKNPFNLSIRPGLNISSLSTSNVISSSTDLNFGNKLTFRLGLEGEFVLPFNKNKWSIIAEPTYQYFKAETEIAYQKVKVDYTSIELALGVRHYIYLNENSKLFINASGVLDFPTNSQFDYEFGGDLPIDTTFNLALGVGYKLNNKYSVELRYLSNREVLKNYMYWGSEYKTASIIFGYSLF